MTPMPIDKAKRDEWRREGPGLVSDPVTTWEETIRPLLDEVERLEREVEARPNPAEVETCHGILRRIRSAAGLPDRYPSFAARPVDHYSDGEEIATRVEAALSLLREIEWSALVLPEQKAQDGAEWSCPVCHWPEHGTVVLSRDAAPFWRRVGPGHAPDCRLKALIG